ncbi:uncharacterized protein LAJ45_06803 [Morchella importuna]|uniref:Cysteine proteinase n=1 Tax=Morchella conica CCBAS932 TaxID=1392247 RepID=A0A3N4KFQ5_9PEZI|nr:uncharacterized protein LAJ45_06803 [Morchella importuna]KAH8149263.1 hypothetical protein LAJ45_06803 [Morchella importuna]RPB09396.1 cysteine proteinase [Morchella conica CCBAS932]
MSKRPADTSLELDTADDGAPLTPKRVRVDEIEDESFASGKILEASRPRPPPEDGEVEEEEEEEEEDGEESALTAVVRDVQAGPTEGFSDLYLDTVNRTLLDFDFEKLCSISLSNINVYACLVCGKYFQGRGRSSHAYTHSLDQDHHVFINIASLRVYVLPESYEVKNKTLEDIKYVANPTYSKGDVAKLDKEVKVRWDLGGKKYIPGFVGLNNIKQNDYLNVVVHALAHVAPLRNYFMLEPLSARPELAQRFSILVRKIWNPRAFKSHVSPHELLQEISLRSSKKFTLTTQSDPVDFLSWFLNHLHLSLGGSKTRPGTSIVQKVFQGRLKVESQAITARADASDRLRFEEAAEIKTEVVRFMMLTLDLPPKPIFKDEQDKNIIPQVPLTTILSKYDGVHSQELLGQRKRYRLLSPLPPFLIFHIKRFSRNKFVSERNPTIVTFPTRSLDMSPYVERSPTEPGSEPVWYDLVANITHESVTTTTGKKEGEMRSVYKVQLCNRASGEWVQIQDLFVEEVARELLFTSESYLQVWERRRGKGV